MKVYVVLETTWDHLEIVAIYARRETADKEAHDRNKDARQRRCKSYAYFVEEYEVIDDET